MKRVHVTFLGGLLTAFLIPVFTVGLAHAYPEFKKEFDKKYVHKGATAPNEAALFQAADKAKCNICHMGKTKKQRNAYGVTLSKFVTKKDKKNAAKIQEALDKAEAEHSDPANATSPTFGELIKEGKLPVEAAH